MYTFDENIVSDLHKDARGFRPSEYFWEEWSQCGDDTRQAIWDGLLVELDEELVCEAKAKAIALSVFNARMDEAFELGAPSNEDAIRWILEGEKFSKYDLAYGADYVAWHFGLDYNNPYKADIKSAINSMNIYEEEV
jgi:hypothetical protein